MISPSQRPLPDNTQHPQQTNIHAPGGIRTHNLSRRAAEDLRLRPRGHWDRPLYITPFQIVFTHVSEVRIVSMFRIRQCTERNKLMDPEDERAIILRNIGNYFYVHTVHFD